ncbi:major allergen alt [Paramyrothecium foliicola]|nr:major allergen alt [Paramyrothecium foliicola]
MRTEIIASLLALAAPALASDHAETVYVSDLNIHKHGSPVGDTIKSVSFKLNGADAKDLECSSSHAFAFPSPVAIFRCGNSDYSFAIFEGENGADFATMLYHDVGDPRADLRGLSDVVTECDNSHGTGPADLICKQEPGEKVTFTIDGPVGSHHGGRRGWRAWLDL